MVTNWVGKTNRFKDKRMGNLLVVQGHSYDHFIGRCDAPAGQPFPNPPTNRYLACPLCGLVKDFNSFEQEHCPQKGGQSDFGGAACVVLTCKDCNHGTNELYEQIADEVQKGAIAPSNTMGHISINPDNDLWVVESLGDPHITYANLKTAFLVAFAVLGYGFALAHELVPVRQAILSADMNSDLEHVPNQRHLPPMGGPIGQHHLSMREPFTVLETSGSIVEVISDDFGWQFPVGNDYSQKTQPARTYAWPKTHDSGNYRQMMDHWQNRSLFHLEWCSTREDHPWAMRLPRWTALKSRPMAGGLTQKRQSSA